MPNPVLGLHSFMTDGTSQGLFIVVAIVIFGIFTVLAYILFEDTLSPALASMFVDATETAEYRLNNNRKLVGSWDKELDAVTDHYVAGYEFYEYVNYGTDFTPIIEKYGLGEYELEFELKTTNDGLVRVYLQNGAGTKYEWGNPNVMATTTYQKYTMSLDVVRSTFDEEESMLSFFGETYQTGRFPTVKNVKLYKIRKD